MTTVGAAAEAVPLAGRVAPLVGGGNDAGRRIVENFEVLAEAAGGAERLRRVVLALAVQGRVVEQRASEGTACDLFSEVLPHRAHGVSDGRTAMPLATLPEEPFSIPTSWRWVRLGDLGSFLGGGTPSKSNVEFWKGPIPWVSPKDMKRTHIDDAEDHISKAALSVSATKLIPSGSLLFVVRGMILAHSFPVALTTREVTINQDMKALDLERPELGTYLLLACRAARDRVLALVERSSHGTCRLASEILENLPLPVPPIAEQKRIVAKVDQLMALCDEFEARKTKKDDIGTRLAKAAFVAMGTAATPDEIDIAWRRLIDNFAALSDSPAKVMDLRAAVLALGLGGWLTRNPRGADRAPLGWRRTTLGELASFVTSGSRNWKNFYVPSGAIFVRSQDIKTDALDLSQPAHVAPPQTAEGTRTRIEKDDLLITITGANVGKTAHVRDHLAEAYVSQHVGLVRLKDRSLATWLHRWLVSPANGRGQLLGSSYGDKPGLNLNNVKDVIVDVPPDGERDVVLVAVDRLLARCEELQTGLISAGDRAAKLAVAIVDQLVSADAAG